MIKSTHLVAAFAYLLSACNDGPSEPIVPPLIAIEVEGRAERGGLVSFVVKKDGVAIPASAFSITALPASNVQFISAASARLTTTGKTRFIATVGTDTGSVEVDAALPPALLFESIEAGNRDVWSVALDGLELRRITTDPAEDRWPSAAAGAVYFVSYRIASGPVFVVPPNSSDATRVSLDNAQYSEVSISPDGTQLLFLRSAGGVGKIWVSARDGTAARRLTATAPSVIEASPAWSPDGHKVAYVSTLSGNPDIYVSDVTGGTPQLVAAGTQTDIEPAWSPDGTRLVFVRGGSDDADLYTVTVAGAVVTQLTQAAGSESRPLWLKDGRIVFAHRTTGDARLVWIEPGVPNTMTLIPVATFTGRPSQLR